MQRRRRQWLLTSGLYVWAVLRQFRGTLLGLALAVLFGGGVYYVTPTNPPQVPPPDLLHCFHAAWMAMLAQSQQWSPVWYLTLLTGVYPLIGFVLVGEGIVRLALLLTSKREGESEWMKVMASTYRDHIVLCGVGHLGYRVLEQLVASHAPVVAIEKDGGGRFVAQAKAMGVPVLIRDMKDDQSLVEAGVPQARVIVIATNDDMANLEVALDARRMNPKIRVLMRLFDQQIAAKVSDAFMVDVAFSSSALAAPLVAAMSLDTRVGSAFMVAGVPHVSAELTVEAGSVLAGKKILELEKNYAARVLARTPRQAKTSESPPPLDTVLSPGDVVVVFTASEKLPLLAADSKLSS